MKDRLEERHLLVEKITIGIANYLNNESNIFILETWMLIEIGEIRDYVEAMWKILQQKKQMISSLLQAKAIQ